MDRIVILENNEEYNEIKSIVHNDTCYLLLSNASNPKDICIRKIKKENKKEYICRLDEDEFNNIIKLFIK